MATDMDSKEGTSRLTGSSQQKSASTTVSETRQASGDASEPQQAPFKSRRPMRSTAMLAGGRYGASKMVGFGSLLVVCYLPYPPPHSKITFSEEHSGQIAWV